MLLVWKSHFQLNVCFNEQFSDGVCKQFPVLNHQVTMKHWQLYVVDDLFFFSFFFWILPFYLEMLTNMKLRHIVTTWQLAKTQNPIYQLYVAIILTIIGVHTYVIARWICALAGNNTINSFQKTIITTKQQKHRNIFNNIAFGSSQRA